MKYRKLGKSDLNLSEIGLGTWLMGRAGWVNVDDKASIAAIHKALELGVNWIDTAEIYGQGHSEQVVGKALKNYRREAVIISTKADPTHAGREQLHKALNSSLKRLKTDYVDLYYIHWPSAEYHYHSTRVDVPRQETMEALLTEQKKGKIRHIGVSNFDAAQMADMLQFGRIESLQPPYSLYWRHVEKEDVPFCLKHNIGIVAYSPMAQGLLTGKFSLQNRPVPEDNRAHNKLFLSPVYEVALDGLAVVRAVAGKYGKTTGQTAVRWVLQQRGITSAIVGARNVQHVMENVGAADWELSGEDIDALNAVGHKVMAALPDNNPTPFIK